MFRSFVALSLACVVASDATPPEAHRWWRLQAPGETKWALVEVKWKDVSGADQTSSGAPLSSGSHASWCTVDATRDGDAGSYWMESKEATEDRWVGVRFGSPTAVATVDVKQYAHENYRVWLAELAWSDDGSSWHVASEGELDGGTSEDGTFWETVHAVAPEGAGGAGAKAASPALDFF